MAESLRRSETRLAWIALTLSAIYIPMETWVSLPDLTHPFFVIDAVAMALVVWGAVHSLRAPNAWSAAGRRYYFPEAYNDGQGLINAAVPAIALTVIVLFFFAWSLYLTARAE